MRRGLAILMCVLAFCGCSDDEKGPTGSNGNQEHDGTITATITGDIELAFNCSDAYGLRLEPRDGASGSMHIQGDVTQGSDTYMIDIQVYHDPGTGTYEFAFPPVDGVGSIIKNEYSHYSESGSVTFTQVSSTRMTGTFSFHAFRVVAPGEMVTVDVAEGVFDVPVILDE